MSRKTKLLSSVLFAFAIFVTLAACSTASPAPAPTPFSSPAPTSIPASPMSTIVPATTFTVTAVDKLHFPSGDVFLAPDGSRIAWTDGSRICLYSLSGKQQACAASKNGIDPNSVRWSPDVQHIAFTENFLGKSKEPDVWVFDVNSQQLIDLTPDQASNVAFGQFEGNWDLWPQWSYDSRRLLFVRYAGSDQDKQGRPQLFTISADGGEPQLVNSIQNTTKFYVDVMPTWSTADGSIGYNIRYIGFGDQPDVGLWVANADGRDAHHALSVPKGNGGEMLEINFSADKRYLLMPYDYLQVAGEVKPLRSLRIAAIDGSSEFPVASDDAAYFAMWAPCGSGLAYIVRSDPRHIESKQPSGLYVVDKPGAHGRLIYAGELWSPFKAAFSRMPTWATNNTILVLGEGSYLLLHLNAE